MLDHGHIVERYANGPLMARDGVYARLYVLHRSEADAGASRTLTAG
jgi:hypothetical protein